MTFVSTVTALSPTAWYRCNESSGTTLNDSSGNGHNGSISGTGITYTNLGFTNDGNRSIGGSGNVYFNITNSGVGFTNSPFTVGFFFEPTTVQNSYFISAFMGSTTVYWAVHDDGTNLTFNISSGYSGSSSTNTSAGLVAGTPVLVWVTYDGSGNWGLYLNGSSTATAAGTAAWPGTSGSSAIGVGLFTNLANTGCPGYYQDIMLFNSVISATNRANIYSASQATSGGSSGGSGTIGNGTIIGTPATGTGGTLVAGSANLTATNLNNSVSVSWGAATGGTGAISYQLYRNTSYQLTPTGTVIASGGGTSYTDAPPDNQTYFYSLNALDSSSTPQVAGYICQPGAIEPTILLCAIGDSRTAGNGSSGTATDPVSQMAYQLSSRLKANVSFVNAGLSGSNSGQWVQNSSVLNGALNSFYTAALAMPANSKVYISYNVGVNDSQVSILQSNANYRTFVASAIAGIKAANIPQLAGIVLHGIFYAVPGKQSAFTTTSASYIQGYNQQLLSLVDNVSVFAGDFLSYAYFAANWPEYLSGDGVHPGNQGYEAWAALMASSYINAFFGGAVSLGSSLSAGYVSSITAGSVYQVDTPVSVASKYGVVHIYPNTPISDPHILQLLLSSGAQLRLHP